MLTPFPTPQPNLLSGFFPFQKRQLYLSSYSEENPWSHPQLPEFLSDPHLVWYLTSCSRWADNEMCFHWFPSLHNKNNLRLYWWKLISKNKRCVWPWSDHSFSLIPQTFKESPSWEGYSSRCLRSSSEQGRWGHELEGEGLKNRLLWVQRRSPSGEELDLRPGGKKHAMFFPHWRREAKRTASSSSQVMATVAQIKW